MTVIMHSSLQCSLAFILANKLQSSTLLGTQLTRLFVEAYEVSLLGWQLWAAPGSMPVLLSVHKSSSARLLCPSHLLPCWPLQDDPSLVEAAVADLQAVVERDPACDSFVQPLLFFKGFQVRRGWAWGVQDATLLFCSSGG